jgi:hypothetical protein
MIAVRLDYDLGWQGLDSGRWCEKPAHARRVLMLDKLYTAWRPWREAVN